MITLYSNKKVAHKFCFKNFGLLSLLLFIVSVNLKAQHTITRDISFNSYDTIANKSIERIFIQPDGNILVISNYENHPYRLNQQGIIDTSFTMELANASYASELFPTTSGKIYAQVIHSGNPSIFEFRRFNANGTLDNTFNCVDTTVGYVIDVEMQADEKVIALYYLPVGSQKRIKRFNYDGSIDSSFAMGSSGGATIGDIALQSDQKCIVAGNFSNYGGQSLLRNVIRLNTDGTVDTTFRIGLGSPNTSNVYIDIQNDGKILFAGGFNFSGPAPNYDGLIRFNTDGSLDTSFISIPMGPNSNYYKFKSLDNGKILMMGDYGQLGSTANNSNLAIHRLLSNGNIDSTYHGNFPTGYLINSATCDITDNGDLYFGKNFHDSLRFNDTLIGLFARITYNGYLDPNFRPWNSSMSDMVHVVKQFQDGGIWLGGRFVSKGQTKSPRLIKLTPTGEVDSSFDLGSGFDYSKLSINDILELPNNKLLVAGEFNLYNNIPVRNIVQLNQSGVIDNSFQYNDTTSGFYINRIIKQPDSKIICLSVNLVSGSSSFNVFRLNSNGSIDASFNTGTGFISNCSVCSAVEKNAIQLDNAGRIVLGGSIIEYNGQVVNKIMRMNSDGSRDTTFALTFGFDKRVQAISIQPDNKVIVAGQFQDFNSQPVPTIVRLLENGQLDTTFNFPLLANYYNVYSKIAVLSNGKILVTYNSDTTWSQYDGIIRLNNDGSIDTTFTMESGFTGTWGVINDFELMNDNSSLLIAGILFEFDGTEFNHIIKLKETQPAIVNFNEAKEFTSNFNVFPNPTSDKVTIKFPNEQDRKIEITNALGQLINSYNCKTNQFEITIEKQGIYFISVTDNLGNNQTKKVVKL